MMSDAKKRTERANIRLWRSNVTSGQTKVKEESGYLLL